MLSRRQGLKAGLAFAGAAAGGGSALAATAPPRVVPVSEQRNRFLVEVEVNGAAGFRFVLDTGASTHFIFSRLVEALSLPQVDRRMTKGYGGRLRESVVGLDSLVVGGVALRRVDAVVWPQDRLEDHDGLIGYPFLFPNAVLSLGAGELTLGGARPDALVPVEAQVMRNQTLLIGGVSGVQGRFVFDTGAQNCTVTPAYLDRIAATGAFRDAPKLGRRDAEGRMVVAAFRPEEMSFGAFRLPRPTIRVAATENVGSVFDDVDGLFGVSLIKPYAWALDQAARSLHAGPMAPA
jgi:predicted aspartyl protease